MKTKTVYGLISQLGPDAPWSPPAHFKTKAKRDQAAAFGRIIGGFRNQLFEKNVSIEEFKKMDFEN